MAWRRRKSSGAGSWWRTQWAAPTGRAIGTWLCRLSSPVCGARPPGAPLPLALWWVSEERPRSPSRRGRRWGRRGCAWRTGPWAPGRRLGCRWSWGGSASAWRSAGSPAPSVSWRMKRHGEGYVAYWPRVCSARASYFLCNVTDLGTAFKDRNIKNPLIPKYLNVWQGHW